MEEGKILDIAHISFLDMIKVMITLSGPASAKGTMIRNALSTAKKMHDIDFASFDDFLAATDNATNPIAQVEGRAEHQGDFVFGLKNCPFGPSISNYTEVFGSMPEGYADFTTEFNKSSMITDKYRVGEGAGVSPFCSVHQPLRSALADKITIGGKKIAIYQLGCKAGSGKKGFADKWIAEAEVDRAKVDQVLDDHMCCYYLRMAE